MSIKYIGLKEITGPLVILENVSDVSYDEVVEIKLDDGSFRTGRVVQIHGDKVVLQIFEGTRSLSLKNTQTKFTGHPMQIALSPDILGRTFNGSGKPIDGLGQIYPEKFADINGHPINPVSRTYPKNYINTGISAIDLLTTLIRGQKLPIFSGAGMNHNKLAAQIVHQAKIDNSKDKNDSFCIVFAAMGIKNDIASYFQESFKKAGVLQNVIMFLNLSNDPIIERILTPRCALTAAEYLAFEHDMHVLVIMTDMLAYAEALREYGSSKGEIPGRKGFPSYLYSDFATLYERAGIIEGKTGSVTQIPILTMPNDDITHPIPDLTGYITEGQIVLDRNLDQRGIYPPISILPSLSRLMKDGIGEKYTRKDHAALANQLFASYAKVQEIRFLSSVIGEEELSELDKSYLKFGNVFEEHFIGQNFDEDRSIEQTLNLGWCMLKMLPKTELDRIDESLLNEFYDK